MYLKSIRLNEERIADREIYPFDIPAIRTLGEITISRAVTFFVGENGSGKSTLLEAIADKCGFNTAGGGRNNYFEADAADAALGNYLTLGWMPKVTNGFFLRAETFHQFASHIDSIEEGPLSYGEKSLHHQSHGEAFLSLFQHRFGRKAIYLLDEPEAALSPQRQLAFLSLLNDLTINGDCQFIIATHSPILLGYPDSCILNFDGERLEEVEYEETDHYQITKNFMDNRKRLLHELFKED